MRRPKFSRWIRLEVMRLTGVKRFNFRKFTTRVQENNDVKLAAALLLYAHENDCIENLMECVYDENLRNEYNKVEKHLGDRSVERLALRGTPMMSLPEPYREIMAAYEEAYYTPERIAEEKRALHEKAQEAVLRSGISTTELAKELGVDRANLSAYLTNGETHRLSTEAVERLANFDVA